MHYIEYSNELNLVYARIWGETSQSETMSIFRCISKNLEIPKEIQLISDYRDAIPNQINTQQIQDTVDHVNALISHRFDRLRWAHISATPQHAVGSTLFELFINNRQISFKQFSTLSAALKWIGADIHALDNLETWLRIE
jgi:hypothetical protein